jgi:NTP pyrophosphatase (non-canonical NTP hydrolase)
VTPIGTPGRRPAGSTPVAAPVDLAGATGEDLGIRDLQATIRATYGDRDRRRGTDAALGWFVEEVGELSRAIRRQGHDQRVVEFADVLAWLVTLADLSGVDLADAATRYADGCPRCGGRPCTC